MNIKTLTILSVLCGGLVACAGLQLPDAARAVYPVLKKNPPSTVQVTAYTGEFKNSETTRVVDARASWMVGTDKAGRSWSLVVIGRKSVSELDDKTENAQRINFDRAYAGGKVEADKWNLSVLFNDSRYRVEAELSLPVTDKFTVMPGVRHENRFAMKRKQTTLRVAGKYQLTKHLSAVLAAEIENEGTGADFVNDRVGGGLLYEF